MRFRTELVPAVLIVSSTALTIPLVTTGCKKDTVGADASTRGPIIIKRKDDIPPMLGGAAVQYTPPPPSASVPHASAPAQGGGAKGPSAAAAAAEPAAAAPATPEKPSAVAITHNHPPDQPCQPLKREDVEKALNDLQKTPQ